MNDITEHSQKIKNLRKVVRYSVSVAAGIIVIAGIIFAYNFYNLSPDKVFQSNYIPYELNNTSNDSIPGTIIEKTFREKNYKGVTVLSHEITNLSVEDRFLVAVSWMETGDNTKAISAYKKILDEDERNNNANLKEETEYYLMLTYIRDKDYDLALDIIDDIQNNPNHTYYKKITPRLTRQVKMLKWR